MKCGNALSITDLQKPIKAHATVIKVYTILHSFFKMVYMGDMIDRKSGKWADDPKSDTSVPGTFEESGEPPEEPGQGARTDITQLYHLIADEELSNAGLESNPGCRRGRWPDCQKSVEV